MKKYEGFRADRLKKVMEKHGVTTEEIEEVLSKDMLADMHHAHLCMNKLLNDKKTPTLQTLFIICEVCNCSADYLLGLSDDVW